MSEEIFIDGDVDTIQLRVQGNTTQTNPLQTWEDSDANVLAQVDENGQVLIDGQRDQVQLRVQAHSAQTEPLQTWEKSDGTPLAQVTDDGRLELGDLDLGTPDGLIEANREITLPSTVPQRGVQSQGKVTGNGTNVIDGAIAWAVHELELLGDAVVSGAHAALRGKITRKNTSASPQAELRAADFEAINDTTSGANPVGKLVGVHSAVTNEQDAYLTEAVGVGVQIANEGAASQLSRAYGLRVEDMPAVENQAYAIHTGTGTVHLGDDLEMPEKGATPVDPPAGARKLYPKSDGWYDLDSQGSEKKIGSSVSMVDAVPVDAHLPDDEFDTNSGGWEHLDESEEGLGLSWEINNGQAHLTAPPAFSNFHPFGRWHSPRFDTAYCVTDELDYTGATKTASSFQASYPASQAFDNSSATCWSTALYVVSGWLQVQFAALQTVNQYAIRSWMYGSSDTAPRDWTFEGSLDGTNWTILDTRQEVTFYPNQVRLFTLPNVTNFTYYRLNITQNGGSSLYLRLAEFDLGYDADAYIPTDDCTIAAKFRLVTESLWNLATPDSDLVFGLVVSDANPMDMGAEWLMAGIGLHCDSNGNLTRSLEGFAATYPATNPDITTLGTPVAGVYEWYARIRHDAADIPAYRWYVDLSYDGLNWVTATIDTLTSFTSIADGLIGLAIINHNTGATAEVSFEFMRARDVFDGVNAPCYGRGITSLFIEWGVQEGNKVFAGPATGVADTPTFRSLVADDIPFLTAAKISDFDAEVSNNTDVTANTTHRQTTSGNPHNVTASEIGNAIAQWNANQLQGCDIRYGTPMQGEVLTYNMLQEQWEPNRLTFASRYCTDAGQSIPNNTSTIVNFEDATFDFIGWVTTGANWKFTAWAGGYYHVSAMIEFAATTAWAVGERAWIGLYKNGALYSVLDAQENNGSASHRVILQGDDAIQLADGDYIDIRVTQASGAARALMADGTRNHVSIMRIAGLA